MKKIILLLLLVLVSVTASARKSYITVVTPSSMGSTNTSDSGLDSGTKIYLTGDVPNDIEGFEYNESYHYWSTLSQYSNPNFKKYSTGEILSVLSEYGYDVEFVVDFQHIILSKEISSNQTISKGDVNTDGEVNIADVNEVISLILGIVREHPEILEQIRK